MALTSTTTTTSTTMNGTWADYCNKLLNGSTSKSDVFNALTIGFLNDDEKYLNAVLEHQRVNFILVPSSRKGEIHCVHHCSVCEDDLSGRQITIGVHGTHPVAY